MITMRAEDVAFVQGDGQRTDVVISVPDDRHLRFVFTDVGFVRVLCNAKKSKRERKKEN